MALMSVQGRVNVLPWFPLVQRFSGLNTWISQVLVLNFSCVTDRSQVSFCLSSRRNNFAETKCRGKTGVNGQNSVRAGRSAGQDHRFFSLVKADGKLPGKQGTCKDRYRLGHLSVASLT